MTLVLFREILKIYRIWYTIDPLQESSPFYIKKFGRTDDFTKVVLNYFLPHFPCLKGAMVAQLSPVVGKLTKKPAFPEASIIEFNRLERVGAFAKLWLLLLKILNALAHVNPNDMEPQAVTLDKSLAPPEGLLRASGEIPVIAY